MNAPVYVAPDTLEAALGIKQRHGADSRVIAGGTDLILRMRDKVLMPGVLVDLRHLQLDSISCGTDELRLGSYVTQSQILANIEIREHFPALAEACRLFAGPPIRNRGTVGGNIVNASPAADLVPPLMAYDSRVVLNRSGGSRVLSLDEFFTGPGQTVMEPDEILTEVRVPQAPPRTAARFAKLDLRRSMAISIVNLAIRLTLSTTGEVSEARIVLGAVASTVIRAVTAERLLVGKQLSIEILDKAAEAARREASPITDVRATKGYRERMVEVLVRRALQATWKELQRDALDA